MLPTLPATLFPQLIRTRGDEYVARHVARIVRAAPDLIQGVVTGTAPYTVAFSAKRGEIAMSCTCPYSLDGLACKHMWALLREADREDLLAPLLAFAGPEPAWIPTPLVRPLTGEGADLLEFERVYPPRVARPASADTAPTWKRLLSSARSEMAHEARRRPGTPWPPNERLVYIVDLAASWSPEFARSCGARRPSGATARAR